MATAAKVTTDLTTCSVCLEVFDNPKSLPCLHAFCLKCLQGHFKDKRPGDNAPCPICRKGFKIPSDGLGGLQHHFFVQRLVDARKASRVESSEVLCEVCMEESGEDSDEIPSATTYCVDCDQKLCEQCSRSHRRMKSGAHQVRPLGAELEQELIQLRGSYCDQHKDRRVEMYCYECNENICLMCFAIKHRQHETAEISETAKTFTQQMNSDAEHILSLISNIQERTRENKKKRSEFMRQADRARTEMEVTGSGIKETVDYQVALQMNEVEMIKSQEAKKAQTVEQSCQLALMTMESFRTYSRELLDKGKPSDITRAASELHKRATELLDSYVTSAQYYPPHVTFTPADVTQVKQLNLIGQVTIATDQGPGTRYGVSYVRVCA